MTNGSLPVSAHGSAALQLGPQLDAAGAGAL